jgi:hypothetical protein
MTCVPKRVASGHVIAIASTTKPTKTAPSLRNIRERPAMAKVKPEGV